MIWRTPHCATSLCWALLLSCHDTNRIYCWMHATCTCYWSACSSVAISIQIIQCSKLATHYCWTNRTDTQPLHIPCSHPIGNQSMLIHGHSAGSLGWPIPMPMWVTSLTWVPCRSILLQPGCLFDRLCCIHACVKWTTSEDTHSSLSTMTRRASGL